MKIVKKVLASLAITGIALTMTSFNAIADGVTTARLFGLDRIGTAIAVADAGWTTADTAILAPSADANLVDALSAAPLAGKTAPILLTDNNTLTDATKIELVNLGVKNVYLVGAISQTVVDQINAMVGVTATVLKGADRIGTAVAISSKLTDPAGSFVVGYGALADALSIASYAAANNYSILVTNPDGSLPASEAAYKGSTVYIIGGPTLVADIPGATRLFGADRFATNLAVLNALTYKYDNVYVANCTNTHLVDSLVASSLAAKTNSPIVLNDSNGDGSIASTSIHSKLGSTSVLTALGGHTVVSDVDVAQIVDGPLIPMRTLPGGGSISDSVTPVVTAVTGISLNHPTLSLTPSGATGPLVATVSPANATNQAVTWTTSNAAVATVVNGVVTPVNEGTATITVTTKDGPKTANCIVTVSKVDTNESLGVAANLNEFYYNYSMCEGKKALGATLTVKGWTTPDGDIFDSSENARFIVAPFKSYPAMSTIPRQGLNLTLSSDRNCLITNIDGYTLASLSNNLTVNVNSLGEVSVDKVKLWSAQSGYKVVGYKSDTASDSTTLIEENLSDPTNFIGVNNSSVGTAGIQVAAWNLPSTSLPNNFEGFLGFIVNSKGLQPLVASYFASNDDFAPYSTSESTLATGVFAPVEVAQVYASDKDKETSVITVTNSLTDKTATVTVNFYSSFTSSGIISIRSNPYQVNEILGGSQNITLSFQDQYGNPRANQTFYLETGILGLWITQVNGNTITSNINMGTTSSPSIRPVKTPVPLFRTFAPAYQSVSIPGLTASHLNDYTSPVVALTAGDDGTVSITLADGNVSYVANTSSTTANNSYKIDHGTAISHQLRIFSDSDQVWKMGSVLLNWGSQNAPK